MITSQTYHVRLTKTFNKVLYLSKAINQTFAFLAVVSVGRDAFYHCSKEGQILYQYKFDYPVDSFAMINNYEVAILYPRANKIYIFNLIHKRFDVHFHQFMHEEADQSQLVPFSQTLLICVKEKGKYNDHRLILTYYKYPFLAQAKPFVRYQSIENEWTVQMQIFKGNNHSMFIWCKRRHDEEIDMRSFDLTGCFKQYKLRNTLGGYGLNKIEISVNYAFQLKQNQLFLSCFANKNQARTLNKDGFINNNFIINTQVPQSPFVCESKLYLQSPFNDLIIDFLNLGKYSMFRTCSYKDTKVQASPVYYIHNKNEKIICKQFWKCTYLTKYFVPGYSSNELMECEFKNGYVNEFIVHHKTIRQQ